MLIARQWLEDVASHDARPVIGVCSEVDIATGPSLWARLEEAIQTHGGDVVLDLRDTTFIDASGLGVLVRASSRLRQTGARLVLRRPLPAVVRLLSITGLEQVFRTED